jgi:poly-gamma-glutamate synthesis protein (capsule biosynthesis protein)
VRGSSWKEGCPVRLEDLRYVQVSYRGFDGRIRTGELVVHADVVEVTIALFGDWFVLRYPIERMTLVDDFDGDDDLSMAANNTSAFNCRRVAGTDRWSEHAYGMAIDVNPVQNPYVRGDRVDPAAGAAYLNRGDPRPGMLVEGSGEVQALERHGWQWGGRWASSKDYQHLSRSGR